MDCLPNISYNLEIHNLSVRRLCFSSFSRSTHHHHLHDLSLLIRECFFSCVCKAGVYFSG